MGELSDPNTGLTAAHACSGRRPPPDTTAIQRILAGWCEVIGVVANGNEVVDSACVLVPDVVLLDVSLPGESGMRMLPHLRAALPDTRIVMLTTLADPVYRVAALAHGADAFVAKGNGQPDSFPRFVRHSRMDVCSGAGHSPQNSTRSLFTIRAC